MFLINYKILEGQEDDYYGETGFFQLSCNGFTYGEVPPEEKENLIDIVDLYDWFGGILNVLGRIKAHHQIFLCDIESYDTWIKFELGKESLAISVVNAEKPIGTHGIEYKLEKVINGSWSDQTVEYEQFRTEVIEKSKLFINDVLKRCSHELVLGLKMQLDAIEKTERE